MSRDSLNQGLGAAAAAGNLSKVRDFLGEGADINDSTWYDATPLLLAVKGRHLEIVRLLLERVDIDPNKRNENGDTPLNSAVSSKHLNIVELLLERPEIDPNTIDQFGDTPLHCALKYIHVHLDIVQLLLKRTDLDPNKVNQNGYTPLHLAISGNKLFIVQLLLQRPDIYLSKENQNGDTPLHIASSCKHIEMLELLIKRKHIDPNTQYLNGNTVLHSAVSGKKMYIVQLLLNRPDIDFNKDNQNGDTPLHLAVSSQYVDMVQLLLKRTDIDPNKDNQYGDTPVDLAVRGGHLDIVQLLLERSDIDPNREKKIDGDTPLHTAVRGGNLNIVQLLLEGKYIDPDIVNKVTGDAPLHTAVRDRNLEMVQLLLERGDIDPDKVDQINGDTPLHTAVRDHDLNMVKLLLKRGDIDPYKMNKNNEKPIDVFQARESVLEIDNQIKRTIQALFKFHALGLPAEIRALDKESAKVFTQLLEEESYPLFESRVMLAGEQGTGKTTIARYLIGKGPTNIRKSTDGIGLYTGLSYIDRDTEEWLDGKQDFSLAELIISWSLRHKSLNRHTSNISTVLSANSSNRRDENLSLYAPVPSDEHTIGEVAEYQIPGVDVGYPQDEIHEPNVLLGIGKQQYNSLDEIQISNVLFDLDSTSKELENELLKQKGDHTDERSSSNVHFTEENENEELQDDVPMRNILDDVNNHQSDSHNISTIANIFLSSSDQPNDSHEDTTCQELEDVNDANTILSSSDQLNDSLEDLKCKELEDVNYLPILDHRTSVNTAVEDKAQENKPNPGSSLVVGDTKQINSSKDVSMHAVLAQERIRELTKSSEVEGSTSGLHSFVESITNQGVVKQLKKFFNVSKNVKEIKVSITEKHILQQSLKVGKKKLHHRHIAPVIIWDFGGQDVFYSTHQSFLSYRAIYLIVLDGSRTLDDPCQFDQYLPGKSGNKTARDYLRFWINTIVTYCKGSQHGFPKIMIVFTHKDKVKHSEVETTREQLFGDVRSMFHGTQLMSHLLIEDKIFVNARNKNDPEMAHIRTSIIRESKLQPTWGQQLPKCFIPLELEFDNLIRKDINVITFDYLKRINSQHPIRSLTDAELKVFLKFQHAIGKILYFDEPGLDQHVTLLPTYLIDAFKSIITDKRFCKGEKQREELWDLMSQKGVISKDAITELWGNRKYRRFEQNKHYLIAVMTHLDILVEPKRYDLKHNRIPTDFYFVASMVQAKDDTEYLQSAFFTDRNIALSLNSNSAVIPPALSFRFITYCLSIFDVKKYGKRNDNMLFHRSAVFTIDPSLDIHVLCEDERIVVRLVHARKKVLILKDLASSICECLKSALQNISQLYIKTSSDNSDVSIGTFEMNLCCSFAEDPCLISIGEFNKIESIWICPGHQLDHEKFVLSSWITEKETLMKCENTCPVTNEEFLSEDLSALHLRRLSILYSVDEIRQLVGYLNLPYTEWDDLFTSETEPQLLKFRALCICQEQSTLTFRDIKKAVEKGQIQNPHTLCKVMRCSSVDFDTDPEKWDMVPSDEDIDKMSTLIGNKSLFFLVELGMDLKIWDKINYSQMKRDLVKLNKDILDEWRVIFCKANNVRPTMRMIANAYKSIGKDVRVIETTLFN